MRGEGGSIAISRILGRSDRCPVEGDGGIGLGEGTGMLMRVGHFISQGSGPSLSSSASFPVIDFTPTTHVFLCFP